MVPPPPAERIATLLQAYVAAEYRCAAGDAWHALRIGERADTLEAATPGIRRFGLITAWDPQSLARPDALNRQADAALQRDLAAGGWPFTLAFATAAQGDDWREPGWLAQDIGMADLDDLARRYGQLGVLGWASGAPVRLRMYAACPPACAGLAHIDWCGA